MQGSQAAMQISKQEEIIRNLIHYWKEENNFK